MEMLVRLLAILVDVLLKACVLTACFWFGSITFTAYHGGLNRRTLLMTAVCLVIACLMVVPRRWMPRRWLDDVDLRQICCIAVAIAAPLSFYWAVFMSTGVWFVNLSNTISLAFVLLVVLSTRWWFQETKVHPASKLCRSMLSLSLVLGYFFMFWR